MKFKDFLNEKYKLLGKLKPYEKILYNAYIDFLQDYFKTSLKIEISFRKPNKKIYFGWIDLIGLSNGKYKIIVEHVTFGLLGKIGHEFTHCWQYKSGSLGFSADENHLLWKGKEYISVKDLNSITDFGTYKKLPWEAEAYNMQDKLPELFLKSKFFQDIKDSDENITYLFDNNILS